MIDLIGVKKPGTFSELRARPRDWDLIRASPSRPATSKNCATKGRTKDRTRSRVHKFRKSLQTERHPQKKVRRRSTSHRQSFGTNFSQPIRTPRAKARKSPVRKSGSVAARPAAIAVAGFVSDLINAATTPLVRNLPVQGCCPASRSDCR